jgi:hypothetical protein
VKVILSRAYACAPEGHTVIRFEAGETVEGKVAELALADGAAVEVNVMPALETKIEPPSETKTPAKNRTKKG